MCVVEWSKINIPVDSVIGVVVYICGCNTSNNKKKHPKGLKTYINQNKIEGEFFRPNKKKFGNFLEP